MSNHKNIAIELNSVSKSYKLYPSPLSQAVDVLGFRKVFFLEKSKSLSIT